MYTVTLHQTSQTHEHNLLNLVNELEAILNQDPTCVAARKLHRFTTRALNERPKGPPVRTFETWEEAMATIYALGEQPLRSLGYINTRPDLVPVSQIMTDLGLRCDKGPANKTVSRDSVKEHTNMKTEDENATAETPSDETNSDDHGGPDCQNEKEGEAT